MVLDVRELGPLERVLVHDYPRVVSPVRLKVRISKGDRLKEAHAPAVLRVEFSSEPVGSEGDESIAADQDQRTAPQTLSTSSRDTSIFQRSDRERGLRRGPSR